MVTNDERMRVLRMVEDGRITAEQGAELISALGGASAPRAQAATIADSGAATLRVVVTDLDSGRDRVNVRVPARLIDLALRFGARFVPRDNGIDLDELMDAVHAGATGKVADVTDHAGGQRVSIFVE